MEEKALKFDGEKPRFSLVPQHAIIQVIRGFEYGAAKYGKYNYSKGMEHTRYVDAAFRHMNAYLLNEDIDESGVHHLALVACNALMALENIITATGEDTRNKTLNK
jgi:hypothetical protein